MKHLSTENSRYVTDNDRYVVMLAVGYGDEDGVTSILDAAHSALNLTEDEGCADTLWLVLDRETGEVVELDQGQFYEVGYCEVCNTAFEASNREDHDPDCGTCWEHCEVNPPHSVSDTDDDRA